MVENPPVSGGWPGSRMALPAPLTHQSKWLLITCCVGDTVRNRRKVLVPLLRGEQFSQRQADTSEVSGSSSRWCATETDYTIRSGNERTEKETKTKTNPRSGSGRRQSFVEGTQPGRCWRSSVAGAKARSPEVLRQGHGTCPWREEYLRGRGGGAGGRTGWGRPGRQRRDSD